MKTFQELDQETILKLLEGQTNVLKEEASKEQELFSNCPCPTCGSYTNEFVLNTKRPFTPGKSLPNKILRCILCQTEHDPYTKIVLRPGISIASSD